jgi:hypothetical protein
MSTTLSYGGGRQTIAICVMIRRGVLPRPDLIVMADTGRENASTWRYLEEHIQPLLKTLDLEVVIATRSLSKVDLYAHNGDLLIPAYTLTGALPAFCSQEWKRYVVRRYLRSIGITAGEMWIGFALDERQRATRLLKTERCKPFEARFPLIDAMLTTAGCIEAVKRAGLPEPPHSSCWMCPHKRNAEWLALSPEEFAMACNLDDEVRAEDIANGGSGVYLHHSRVPLRQADLTVIERTETAKQCGLGMCFV